MTLSSDSRPRKSWFGRHKWPLIIGLPLLWFVFGPFPFGMGFYYPIRDNLRGHPQGHHGTQPPNFVGLWVRDKAVEFDFVGQAFYLMPDGNFAQNGGLTVRHWHFDNDRLFVDSFSRCGNCYHGNITTELKAKFVGHDQLIITRLGKESERGIGGVYRRVPITDSLKNEMSLLCKSENYAESSKAMSVLNAIETFEKASTRSLYR